MTKKPSKKYLKLMRQIRDRERRFQKMTQAQKRVAIAKDVLTSLRLGTITAESGTYVDGEARETINEFYYYESADKSAETDARDILLKAGKIPSCTACAVGSMFVCALLRDDNLTVAKFRNENWHQFLKKYFSWPQICNIEHAFEGGWNESFPDDHDRLKAIMENIVKNGGTFKFKPAAS